MNTQKLDIKNTDGLKLGAKLDLPDDREPLAYALFAHCFTCTKDFKSSYYISRALTREMKSISDWLDVHVEHFPED